MQLILTVLHLLLAIGLIALILVQHGRGADAGAAFGSGASATVFGARGSASFLSRTTGILAALFFLTSMAMAYFAAQVGEPKGLMDDVEQPPATIVSHSDLPVADAAVKTPAEQAEPNATAPDAAVPAQSTPAASSDVPTAPAEPGTSAAQPGPGTADLPPAAGSNDVPEVPAPEPAPEPAKPQ